MFHPIDIEPPPSEPEECKPGHGYSPRLHEWKVDYIDDEDPSGKFLSRQVLTCGWCLETYDPETS